MTTAFDQELRLALEERQAADRYRQRSQLESPQGAHVTVDGQAYLAFCSNDYLGLANHPELIACAQQVAGEAGVGSGASHLVYGHSHYHHQLEDDLARWTGRERALLFSTGYMANLGVISALSDRGDTIYEDKLNHASLIDAGLLSRAKLKRFRHNDLAQLEEMLAGDNSRRKFVVVDGVFSMDGDLAPLKALSELCQRYHAQLVVDDAHGFGVLGETGGGCAQHFGLSQQQLPILIGTLGKSFGSFGAFVVGSHDLIESLIQFARPYIYTTALPPAVAAVSRTSLRLIQNDCARRDHLMQLIHYFREQAAQANLRLMESFTPIQPIVLGEDSLVMRVASQLREQGILVGAIRPPTVPEGTGRLRITINADHSLEDIDQLIGLLKKAISEVGVA